MNKGTNKGSPTSSSPYRIGDVIFIKSGLGSPGTQWIRADSSFNLDKNSALAKKINGPLAAIWVTQLSNTTSQLSKVAYGNGVFLAAGIGGVLRTSTEGSTWVTQTSSLGSSNINAIFYGNNLWFAGGANSSLATSTDAVTWNSIVTLPMASNAINEFATDGSGRVLAVGASGVGALSNNNDFNQWTPQFMWTAGYNSNAATFANNRWFVGGATGSFSVSDNTYNAAGINWATQPNFSANNALSVFYGNNLWVAGDSAGILKTSIDGVTWTTRTSNFGTSSINFIEYANSLWVAAGNGGTLRTSTDAVTWTTQTSEFGTSNISALDYGNSLWVAGGSGGTLRTSTDAVTWNTQTSEFGTSNINTVAFGNNLWVAGGDGGTLRTSTDAITWVTQTPNFGTSNILSVFYGNSLWVAAGAGGTLRTSTDAITWTTRTSNFGISNINTVLYGNSLWIAGGDRGTFCTSTDAITWTTTNSRFLTNNIRRFASGNNMFIAVGNAGLIKTSVSNLKWHSQGVPFGASSINTIVSNGSQVVVGLDGGSLWRSTSNTTATQLSVWHTAVAGGVGGNHRGIAYGDGTWVVTGWNGSAGSIRTSTDLITWVSRNSNVGNTAELYNTAYGDGVFVVVGGAGRVRRSSDNGVTWTTQTPNYASTIVDIAYGNGLFVLVGPASNNVSGNHIRSSTDGITWTTRSSGLAVDIQLYSIAYSPALNLFATCGSQGQIRTSTDAVTWTQRSSGHFSEFFSITSGPLGFLAAGYSTSGNNNSFRSSTDGITWTTRTVTGSSQFVRCVNFGNGVYVAHFDNGNIFASTDFISWSNVGNSGFSVLNAGGGGPRSLVFADNHWVATGQGSDGLKVNAANSINFGWSQLTSNFGTSNIQSVAFGNNIWTAVGAGGTIRMSTDSVSWNTTTSNFGTSTIFSASSDNGLVVAVGAGGAIRRASGLSVMPFNAITSSPSGFIPYIKAY